MGKFFLLIHFPVGIPIQLLWTAVFLILMLKWCNDIFIRQRFTIIINFYSFMKNPSFRLLFQLKRLLMVRLTIWRLDLIRLHFIKDIEISIQKDSGIFFVSIFSTSQDVSIKFHQAFLKFFFDRLEFLIFLSALSALLKLEAFN